MYLIFNIPFKFVTLHHIKISFVKLVTLIVAFITEYLTKLSHTYIFTQTIQTLLKCKCLCTKCALCKKN